MGREAAPREDVNDSSIRVEVVFTERFALREGEKAEDKMGIILEVKGNSGKLGRCETGRAE